MLRVLLAALVPLAARGAPLTVTCPSNCTEALQGALYSGAPHVVVQPPASGGGIAIIGSPSHSTQLNANGTDMLVEFAPGLELHGFLNTTFYPTTGATAKRGYSPALVSLALSGSNVTLRAQGEGGSTVLRRIWGRIAGTAVTLQGLQFLNPGVRQPPTPIISAPSEPLLAGSGTACTCAARWA